MLKSIFNMDLDDIRIKEGDIKVDGEELKTLLRVMQYYHSVLDSLDLSPALKNDVELTKGLEYTEYFQNKYIVLGELRREQKLQYDILQKLNNKEVTSGHSPEEVEAMRREVWGWYLDAKRKREALQAAIDKIKIEKGFS